MAELSYELLLNTFLIYYKKCFPNDNIKTFFDNITDDGDTNKILEHFYQSLIDFKASKYQDAIDYDINSLHILDEPYILNIDGHNTKMSDNVISLLIEVINNYEDTDWIIIEINS